MRPTGGIDDGGGDILGRDLGGDGHLGNDMLNLSKKESGLCEPLKTRYDTHDRLLAGGEG